MGRRKTTRKAGCGATLREWNPPHSLLASDSEHMGCQSNNVAEYGGLILGLNLARSKGAVRVEVRGDSKLVINQMGYGWACRKLPLIRLQRVARRIMRDLTAGVDFTWVPREKIRMRTNWQMRRRSEKTPGVNGEPFFSLNDEKRRGRSVYLCGYQRQVFEKRRCGIRNIRCDLC